MYKAKWIDRELISSQVYYCLCTTEKQYLREMKKLHVKSPNNWLINSCPATTHFLEQKGEVSAVVCINPEPSKSIIQIYSLLVHESVHIHREICRQMNEKFPGEEFEAYSIQRISSNLMHYFTEYMLKNKPKKFIRMKELTEKFCVE